jgi:hypothetical protein
LIALGDGRWSATRSPVNALPLTSLRRASRVVRAIKVTLSRDPSRRWWQGRELLLRIAANRN